MSMRFFIMTFFILLTGCGFHLRGLAPLPPSLQRIYIESKGPYGLLEQKLRATLPLTHVHIMSTPESADTILVISNETPTQQLVSVGGTQQTRQYNLTLAVTFAIADNTGKLLIAPQTVSEMRTLTLQSSQILGTTNEQATLYQVMRQAIVYDIIDRLSSKKITDILMKKPAE
ncbi:MAG: LPS assembly lipoprotein LptE [Gammaproteobacteria bacterium]|nr:LPS assembly lipoprotein LptE [Gammaproteobacteria bacterium]